MVYSFILSAMVENVKMKNAVKISKSFIFLRECIAFAESVCYTDGMRYKPFKLPSVFVVEKLVTVHYFEMSKHFCYPPEAHDFWELHYVDKGSAISMSDKERHLLTQGDILFHPPMAEHQLVANGDSVPNICVVSFYLRSHEIPPFVGRKLHLSAEERGVMKRFLTEAGNLFDLSKSDPNASGLSLRKEVPLGAAQMVKIHLEELLLLLARGHTAPPLRPTHAILSETYADPLVSDMIAYMQDNIGRNLTIADFCRQFSYGKTHLCTKFFAETGKTINGYFTELKITAAKQIIREQSASRELFSRISDLLGFSSPSYFHYTFKKVTGMTPSQYFKSVRQ